MVAISFVLFPSCALLFSGTKSPVSVQGNPAGADVYFQGNYIGQAPVDVMVPRDANLSTYILVKKQNYQPQRFDIRSRISAGYLILDILWLPNVLPILVDFVSGAIYSPYPRQINYNLQPIINQQVKKTKK